MAGEVVGVESEVVEEENGSLVDGGEDGLLADWEEDGGSLVCRDEESEEDEVVVAVGAVVTGVPSEGVLVD